MPNGKDFYNILGVAKNASPQDVKNAYRKLAREHHPDMVSEGDKDAAEKRFKEISEAYQVLNDPQKRKMYDQFGSAAFAGGPGQGAGGPGGFSGFQGGQQGPFTYAYTSSGGKGAQGFGDFDPFDVFEDFFGFRGFGRSRAPKKGKNLYYEMVISFSEAVFGLEKQINVESGKVKIIIPVGVRDGTEIRFAEKGMPGPGKGADKLPPGDLFITVRLVKPKEFRIYGNHLIISEEIDFTQAILGGTIEIPVVDTAQKSGIGKTKLKIPSGTQHGTRFVVRGKGMPILRSKRQGDVLVEVSVTIPKRLSRKQKELLKKYQKL